MSPCKTRLVLSVPPGRATITINADEHALMRRMHKPGDEKRSLVILPHDEVDWPQVFRE